MEQYRFKEGLHFLVLSTRCMLSDGSPLLTLHFLDCDGLASPWVFPDSNHTYIYCVCALYAEVTLVL